MEYLHVKSMNLIIIVSLMSLFIICVKAQDEKRSGCIRLDPSNQSQYITVDGIEEKLTPQSKYKKKMVVLRLHNNTDCGITLGTLGNSPEATKIYRFSKESKKLEYTIGTRDGERIDALDYDIKSQEYKNSQNIRKRKYVFIDKTIMLFQLQGGKAITFEVPLSAFDRRISVEVPYYYDWDLDIAPNQFYHRAYFVNASLPDDIFALTRLGKKENGCNKAQ